MSSWGSQPEQGGSTTHNKCSDPSQTSRIPAAEQKTRARERGEAGQPPRVTQALVPGRVLGASVVKLFSQRCGLAARGFGIFTLSPCSTSGMQAAMQHIRDAGGRWGTAGAPRLWCLSPGCWVGSGFLVLCSAPHLSPIGPLVELSERAGQ